jgi:hypothetical protein
MKTGYFITENQMAIIATISEVLLESSNNETRVAGELLNSVVKIAKREPLTVDDEEDTAERDAYWDKVCEKHDMDRLANEPSMEGWDAKWAADSVANRLFGG